MGVVLFRMGEVLARRSLFEDGLALIESDCDLADDLGVPGDAWLLFLVLAEAKVHLGRYEEGSADAQQGAAHSALFWALGPWIVGFSRFAEGLVDLADGAHHAAPSSLQEAVAVFGAVRQKENQGWALGPLGLAAREAGKPVLARPYVVEALEIGVELGAFMPVMYGLPVAALLLADQGALNRAVESVQEQGRLQNWDAMATELLSEL